MPHGKAYIGDRVLAFDFWESVAPTSFPAAAKDAYEVGTAFTCSPHTQQGSFHLILTSSLSFSRISFSNAS